jgi:hypothetical protein
MRKDNKQACKDYYYANRERILEQKRNKHPNYAVWHGMLQRCSNSNRADYKYYGGVGISVCERWQDFKLFLEDMGERPTKSHTLDRIDGSLGYYKENCRWATRTEQSANLKSNRNISIEGEIYTLSSLARTLDVSITWLSDKLNKNK